MNEPKYDEDGVNLGYLRRLIKNIEAGIPKATSDLTNDSNFVNEAQMNTAVNNVDTLHVHGINIKENDDLNSYTTAGVYYCPSTAICNSLSNCPVTSVTFKLTVEYLHTTSRMVQTIKLNAVNPEIYIRNYTGSWNSWRKVVLDEIEDFESKVTFHETKGSFNSFRKFGKVITISYQGENKAHASKAELFTLPVGYRPAKTVGTAFSGYGTVYGNAWIEPNGLCSVGNISNATTSARLMFNISFIVD